MDNNDSCAERSRDYKKGSLPSCAPLAAAFVPFQEENAPRYRREDALARGTLFPGLDLPWKNIVNNNAGELADTPLGELMALGFVVHELGLYLDTHKRDREALNMFTEYAGLYKTGMEAYVRRFGPLTQDQVTEAGYTWLNDPWPWEYTERRGD